MTRDEFRAIGGMELIIGHLCVRFCAKLLGADPTPEQWEVMRMDVVNEVAELGGSEHQQFAAWSYLTRTLKMVYGLEAPPVPPNHPKHR